MNASLDAERLVTDLKRVVQDSEALLVATAGAVGEKASGIRERLDDALGQAKTTCHELEDKAVAGAKATDRAIREHPYSSMGVAFGIGFLIGVLVMRK